MEKEVTQWQSRDQSGNKFVSIHGKIVPADVRPQERIVARIRRRSELGDFDNVRIWRISPLGIELEQPTKSFAQGEEVDLEIVIAGQRTAFSGLVVAIVCSERDIELIGIRFSHEIDQPNDGRERRTQSRWVCSEQFYPVCIAPNPTFFDEWMYFQIHDISEHGMQLYTSLGNKFLVPGIHLQLTIAFPMGGSIGIRVEIVRIGIGSLGARDRLILGVKFGELSRLEKTVIGQYLVQFCQTSALEDFQKSGFIPSSLLRGVKFHYIKTEKEYAAVLSLRFEANKKSGQIGNATGPLDMADMEDSRARILVGVRRGKVVATVRMRFTSREDELECEKYVQWPHHLPRRDQIVEISRLAVDHEYRGGDLVVGLLRYVGLTCPSEDRPYLVISAMSKYLPFYKKIGCEETNLSYKDDTWSDELHILYGNYLDWFLGKNVNPIYWNYLWKDVSPLLIESGLVKPTGVDRIRLRFYKLLSPFSGLTINILRRFRRTKNKKTT